ncbi:MAG: DUF3276 family protein [Ginsengibacter sp.]
MESVYSKRIKAGKRRTYFFDVRETRGNDYYLTITESRKRFDSDGYDRHKIFLYKEDFNKFLKGLTEAIDYVKTDLMPDFDFDAFNHDTPYEGEEGQYNNGGTAAPESTENTANSETPATESTEYIAPVSPLEQVASPAAEVSNAAETETKTDETPADNGSTEEVDKW